MKTIKCYIQHKRGKYGGCSIPHLHIKNGLITTEKLTDALNRIDELASEAVDNTERQEEWEQLKDDYNLLYDFINRA